MFSRLIEGRINAIRQAVDLREKGEIPTFSAKSGSSPVHTVTTSQDVRVVDRVARSLHILPSNAEYASEVSLACKLPDIDKLPAIAPRFAMQEAQEPVQGNDDDIILMPCSDDELWATMDDIPVEDAAGIAGSSAVLPRKLSHSYSEGQLTASTSFFQPSDDPTDTPYYKEVLRVLRTTFGLQHFRTNQLEAINATMDGRDVFVLMPTGGGKSLCYQLPAVCRTGTTSGVTVVVSPLIALMNDQVSALKAKNINVEVWNSENSSDDAYAIRMRLQSNTHQPNLLYLTPEKLSESGALKSVLEKLYDAGRLARFVIDEAHCISTWGRDFRDAVSNSKTFVMETIV